MGDSSDVGPTETIITQRKTASVDGADSAAADGGSASGRSGEERASRRRRARRERERRAALSWPMLLGSLLSVAVSALDPQLVTRLAGETLARHYDICAIDAGGLEARESQMAPASPGGSLESLS